MIRLICMICMSFLSIQATYAQSIVLPGVADGQSAVLNVDKKTFKKEKIEINLSLKEAVFGQLVIVTQDGDVVKHVMQPDEYAAGVHKVEWDGFDDGGELVPEEVYFPVWLAGSSVKGGAGQMEKAVVLSSGGEPIEIEAEFNAALNQLEIETGASSRILSRIGVDHGPLLKTAINWMPVNKGRHIIKDVLPYTLLSHILANDVTLKVMATGYRLPDNAIIVNSTSTQGYRTQDYREYRNYRQWLEINTLSLDAAVMREGKRLSMAFNKPIYRNASPVIEAKWLDAEDGSYLQIGIAKQDLVETNNSFFEVAIFSDFKFHEEQEQAFVPFTYKLPDEVVAKGAKWLTVNISSYSGQVGTLTLELKND